MHFIRDELPHSHILMLLSSRGEKYDFDCKLVTADLCDVTTAAYWVS